MGNRVRLIDIANKAGVSKMTVSLALRNDPSISRETTNMIKEIADTLGYVPNRIAKGLVNGRTYTIAAIVGGDHHKADGLVPELLGHLADGEEVAQGF